MPSQQQLLDVIRIQTQITKQGHDLAAVMDLITHETVQLLQVDGAAIAEGQLGLRLGIDSSLSGVLKAMDREPFRFGRPERTLLGLLSEAIAAAMFYATKASQNDLFYLATHDALTGMANRPLFLERLRTLLGSHQGGIGVLRLTIEGLQAINDSHGHQAGDSLIQEAARRLQTVVGERGLVARLGGNSLAVLLTNVAEAAELETLSRAIHTAMQPPAVIGWSHLPLAVRIGTALFPQDASAPEALLELAASPADPLGPDPRSA